MTYASCSDGFLKRLCSSSDDVHCRAVILQCSGNHEADA